MTQLQALKELAEKVEAVDMPAQFADFSKAAHPAFSELVVYFHAFTAYNGSIDAAHSLHKAVLGGRWSISLTQDDAKTWWCVLKEGFQTSYTGVNGATQETPARAWLLAIIKAKITELEQ